MAVPLDDFVIETFDKITRFSLNEIMTDFIIIGTVLYSRRGVTACAFLAGWGVRQN
jgi:hypothetical protein